MKKVIGRRNYKLNNFVDTVANLVLKCRNSKLKRLETFQQIKRLEQDKDHFRIHDFLNSIKDRTLKRKDYLLKCINFGRWFSLATAMADT